jgi:hypothetical protein
MVTRVEALQEIVGLVLLFLQVRRRGWRGLQPLLAASKLTGPAFFLLRAVDGETVRGRAVDGETVRGQALTLQQMQEWLFNPYATRFPVFDFLPVLVDLGYMQKQGEGYLVTGTGRALANEVELAARDYLATLQLPPGIRQSALAEALVELVRRSWAAPEPSVKAHQARTQRRLGVDGAAPLVRIEWAVLGLWEVRDDAHIAAWRAYGFRGPVLDILSHIWRKETQTLPALVATLQETQHPADIEQGVLELAQAGYITSANEQLALTTHGQEVRDAIEAETDRIFFAPWEPVADDKVVWISEQLGELCAYFKV